MFIIKPKLFYISIISLSIGAIFHIQNPNMEIPTIGRTNSIIVVKIVENHIVV
jgi:hypothetical protein